jgi:hypothetical protein
MRCLALCSVPLWLAIAAASAPPPPERFRGDLVQAGAAPRAFRVFAEWLEESRAAAAPNAHWRVELPSWRERQTVWKKVSARLPAPQQALKRCAVPLQKARGLIEQAHRLFRLVRQRYDARAVELLQEHEELRQQAAGPLAEAEACYWAAWAASRAR